MGGSGVRIEDSAKVVVGWVVDWTGVGGRGRWRWMSRFFLESG